MSDLTVFVGKGKKGMLTFSEPNAPADGAVQSSDPTVGTASLDADGMTWHFHGVAASAVDVTMTYTGTSDPPDVGPVVVTPVTFTVMDAPTAETGSFNPALAVDEV